MYNSNFEEHGKEKSALECFCEMHEAIAKFNIGIAAMAKEKEEQTIRKQCENKISEIAKELFKTNSKKKQTKIKNKK